MSMSPQPIKNLETIVQDQEMWQKHESFPSANGFNPLIYGNDVDSVDVATRVAMASDHIFFYNSDRLILKFETTFYCINPISGKHY